jgi:23S rRNA (uracil1939-C5)-methyltransferase
MSERAYCEHASQCGGCPVIGLTYAEQLSMKRGRVVHSTARYPALELLYTEPVSAATPITEYRTRARLLAASGGVLGLYAKGGGHHIVDTPRCRVLTRTLDSVATTLRKHIAADERSRGPLAPFDPSARTQGGLRAVDLREVQGSTGTRALVTFIVDRSLEDRMEQLEEAARGLAAENEVVVGVAVQFQDADAPHSISPDTFTLYGGSSTEDRIGTVSSFATYGTFVHPHRDQSERLHSTIVELLALDRPGRGETRVLDLYGGTGGIALALADRGATVHLVESFGAAIEQANRAVRTHGASLVVEAADVASALLRLQRDKRSFDGVVANPPRRGMSPVARERLANLDVATVVYVSSDPDTMARDLDHFVRLGFTVATLRPLDMIPLTDEVETVALLRKFGASPTPSVIYEDEAILIVDKGAHEPTSPQEGYASSLIERARRLPGASNAEVVFGTDTGTSGLVMLAKDAASARSFHALLDTEKFRRIYVAAARGTTPAKGVVNRDLRDGKTMLTARTRYRRLAITSGHSVLRVIPEQTCTHQIRRHLAAIGHPVLGDTRYGHAPTNRFFEEKNALDRPFLHCVRFEFDHPTTNERVIVESGLPGDLRAVIERTSGPGTLRFLEQKNALGHTVGTPFASMPPSAPPPAHTVNDFGSALDLDSRPSIRVELVNDDDDVGPHAEREV